MYRGDQPQGVGSRPGPNGKLYMPKVKKQGGWQNETNLF